MCICNLHLACFVVLWMLACLPACLHNHHTPEIIVVFDETQFYFDFKSNFSRCHACFFCSHLARLAILKDECNKQMGKWKKVFCFMLLFNMRPISPLLLFDHTFHHLCFSLCAHACAQCMLISHQIVHLQLHEHYGTTTRSLHPSVRLQLTVNAAAVMHGVVVVSLGMTCGKWPI